MEKNWAGFQKKMSEMATAFLGKENWALIYNYDSDGISSGAIIALTIQRRGTKFQTLALKQLYPEHAEQIKSMGKNFFFADFGSGQLDFLKKEFGENFFVLDHHQPLPIEHAWHCNPFLFGFDGGSEISASGMAYFFSTAVDLKNRDLASLAIVGAVGDMQDETGRLIGLNSKIVSDGEAAGVLKKKEGLRLYGRISRPLVQFLMFCTAPYLPELTGNELNCIRFLESLGIELKQNERWISFEMLSLSGQKKLVSALVMHLSRHNVSEYKIQELFGELYSRIQEEPFSPLSDAKEMGTLLNACGRWGKADVGLAVCMGDREEALSTAMSLLVEHRRKLRAGIQWVTEHGTQSRETFYFFDAEKNIDDSIVGIVAGMLYGGGTIGFDKPIIALSRYPSGEIKVSGRATRDLVQRGLNLGKAFHELCAEMGEGNEGGGHKIAAGAKVPEKNRELFLELLDEKIKEQLAKVY
ncbi:MAG: DHH family phosphoesterase [Candidatus Micrarchaeota archaeon]